MALNFPNNPTVDQVYTVDQTSWIWTGSAWNVAGAGLNLLTALTDVNVATVTDGQVLKYNTATQQWVNASDLTGEGGAGLSLSDLSVITAAESGNGSLSYSNISGIFTFTPPSISSTSSITLDSISGTGDISYNNSTGVISFNNITGYITRTGISVEQTAASGNGALSYSNSTGVLTYTPPDLSGLAGGEGGTASNSFVTIAVAGQNSVVADSTTDTLTLASGTGISITTDAATDTITVTNSSPNVSQNVFSTIAVAGQSSVFADSATDTLTLVAGSNISITTNAATDAITINATAVEGTISDSFVTIAVAGQNSVVADSSTDTLTLASGTGISITTDAATDTITITNTAASGGATTFTGLSDSADLTVDKFYLPAITMLRVTNNSSSSYRFDQYGATNNPTVFAINGTTIAFNLTVSGHPFLIQTSSGVNFNEGLVHVTPAGVVSNGSAAQGKTTGTLYWKVPVSISGNYRYICSLHGTMVGAITIKSFSAI